MSVVIAVDVMGGDHGPAVTLVACRAFLDSHPNAELLLVGLPDALEKFQHPRARSVMAAEVVSMDDPVEVALRRKKNSSMRLTIEQVRDGHAQAAVSAGNTGALMAIARYVLKTLDGIDRPAIAGRMPDFRGGGTTMLDLGANVDCSSEHLFQFAVMGSALVSVLDDIAEPRVGLLNIGEEAIKGNEVIKKTADLLRSAAQRGDLNFVGNVEGNHIYQGVVDLIVCDGFVGNVALKASEGLAQKIGHTLKSAFMRSAWSKFVALCAHAVLNDFKNNVDHRRYNGAALLGLNGIVFKSHGSADALAFQTALNRAYDAAHHHLLDRLRSRIAHAAPLLELGRSAQALESTPN